MDMSISNVDNSGQDPPTWFVHPFDIPELLLHILDYVGEYQSCSRVCRRWYEALRPRLRWFVENRCRLLQSVLRLYPNGVNRILWKKNILCCGENLVIGMSGRLDNIFYLNYMDADELSKLAIITSDVLKDKKRICILWNYYRLSWNKNITWDIVQANPDKPWDYQLLSENPNITWDIVQANPDKPWDYDCLSENPNITWDTVRANPNIPWDYYCISEHPNITWDIVRTNPNIPWDYECLSLNPNITWDIVEANPNEGWNYGLLSRNHNITWDIVKANPDKPWDYKELSLNPNITWDIVQANPDKGWSYIRMSSNPNITWDIVQANPDKGWSYLSLSENPNITWNIIKNNYHLLSYVEDGVHITEHTMQCGKCIKCLVCGIHGIALGRKDILADIIMDYVDGIST